MARVIDELVTVYRYKTETKELHKAKQLQDKATESTSRFKRGVDAAADASSRGFRRIADGARRVGQGVANAAKRLAAMRTQLAIVAAAGAAVAIGIKKAVDGFAEFGDKVAKTSKQLGVSSDDYQRLTFAAQRSGASAEELEKGIVTLNKQLANAADTGAGPLVDTFNEIGLSVSDLEGKGAEEKISLIGDALQKVEDPSRRSALAMDIFGKSGSKMLPLLNEGSKGIKALGDRASELGIVIGEDTLAATESYQDAQLDLNETLSGLKNTIVSALVPSLTDAQNNMTSFLVTNKEAIVSGIVEFFEKLSEVISFLGTVVSEVVDILTPFYEWFESAVEQILPEFEGAFLGSFESIKGSVEALGDVLSVFFGNSESEFDSFGGMLKDRFVKVITDALQGVERIFISIETNIRRVGEAFKLFSEGKILDGLAELGDAMIQFVLEPLRDITRRIIGLADSLGAGGIVPDAVREFSKGGAEDVRALRQRAREEKKAQEEAQRIARQNAEAFVKLNEKTFGQINKKFEEAKRKAEREQNKKKPPKKPPKKPKGEKDSKEEAGLAPGGTKGGAPVSGIPMFGESPRQYSENAPDTVAGSLLSRPPGGPQSVAELIDQSGVEGKIGRGNAPPIVIQNFQNRFQIEAPVTISGTFGSTPSQISAEFSRSIEQIFREKVRQAADSIRTSVRL